MLNLVKYELKGRYKFYIGIALAFIVWNIYLITRIGIWQPDGMVFGVSIATTLAIYFAILLFGVLLYNRDLYGDTGYLIFTLPKKGYSIVGSKLIVSLIEIILFGLLSGTFIYIILVNSPNVPVDEIINTIKANFGKILFSILVSLWGYISILLVSYFSLNISKVAFHSGRFRFILSFVIFFLTLYVISQISSYLATIFPQEIIFNPTTTIFDNNEMHISVLPFKFNIAEVVFQIIIYPILFVFNGYLIDKKIDI